MIPCLFFFLDFLSGFLSNSPEGEAISLHLWLCGAQPVLLPWFSHSCGQEHLFGTHPGNIFPPAHGALFFVSCQVCWLTPEQTAGKQKPYMYTQGQAVLNRSFFPCFDSPAVKSTYSASIKVSASSCYKRAAQLVVIAIPLQSKGNWYGADLQLWRSLKEKPQEVFISFRALLLTFVSKECECSWGFLSRQVSQSLINISASPTHMAKFFPCFSVVRSPRGLQL